MNINDVKAFVKEYLRIYNSGDATEYSYRTDFENFFNTCDFVLPVNDPKASTNGKPDFVFNSKKDVEIVLGYAEMKEPKYNRSLDDIEKTEQWSRYKNYSNIFLTDGFDWRFYKNGEMYADIVIIKFDSFTKQPIPITENYERLSNQLVDFFENSNEKITSGKRLAEIMGYKARLIRDSILKISTEEYINDETINDVYRMFKELLVSDLSIPQFADMYAQTLVYGLFVARYNDKSLESFSRSEARDLIPSTNPLLRDFFDHIAGANFDHSLMPVVDSLCNIFCVSDIRKIVDSHLNKYKNDFRDPIIHFYEDFLESYDPKLKKEMGAYYTPTPIVNYIIRAVDKSLKDDFSIVDGLASDEQIDYKREVSQGYTKGRTGTKVYFDETFKIPKVQILDPAVGTATFLNETVKYIYENNFINQQGMWSDYVKTNLLPRLNGFELMMTPYTIAHLKIGMTLAEFGVNDFTKDERLRIFLTNTLTEGVKPDLPLLQLLGLTKVVTKESELAAEVKNKYPVMVVMGNPPYSISSSNKSDFIKDLIKVYKEDLNEKKLNLDDDYIKFIRFSEYLVERNNRGIVAMITNNSYLDGVTHRRMREHLLKTFDKIYILNLHGNSKKKEKSPDGSIDENVFNIMQGVSIVVMVKNNVKRRPLGRVFYADLYGKRIDKFQRLNLGNIDYEEIDYSEPYYFFTKKDFSLQDEYDSFVSLDKLFVINNSGVKTDRDSLFIDFDANLLEKRIQALLSGEFSQEFIDTYNIKDSGSYKITSVIKNKLFDRRNIKPFSYRPFDVRYIYYDPAVISRPAQKAMQHMQRSNLLLVAKRGYALDAPCAFVSKFMSEIRFWSCAGMIGSDYVFPLYLYSYENNREPNFDKDELAKLTVNINEYTPEDIFDYIYAIMFSPKYLERYSEFIKIDFPRIPIPSASEFSRLVPLGRKLRKLHLMEEKLKTDISFPESGDCLISNIYYDSENERVYINDSQYFGNVPQTAWSSFIGGYQPAQKWLKDRKKANLQLSFRDIEHYEQMIETLTLTQEIMNEIG